jgi:hypothetical protein
MTQAYPLDIAREVDRRWRLRLRDLNVSPAQNDNVGDGLCPLCNGYASLAAKPSEYCGQGLVRRHWVCRTCGHEWVTVLHVRP